MEDAKVEEKTKDKSEPKSDDNAPDAGSERKPRR